LKMIWRTSSAPGGKDERYQPLWGYNGDTPARRSIVKLDEAYEPLKEMSSLLVGGSESGDRKGDRGQGWLGGGKGKCLIFGRSAVPPPASRPHTKRSTRLVSHPAI
jgi:hypothetical protein